MPKSDEGYHSYLLRLRRHQRDGRPLWRISLQEPRTGQRHTFRNLDAAVDFLRSQMNMMEVKGDVEDNATGRAST